jgi:hypothetical protein
MKNQLMLFAIMFCFFSCGTEKIIKQVNRKYVAWYSPSQATDVYGVMFEVFPKEYPDYFPNIYGIDLNISPVAIAFLMNAVPYLIIPDMNMERTDSAVDLYKKVYGFQIALLNFEPSIIWGLDINAICSLEESIINGISFSPTLNKHDIVNGLSIAVLSNNDRHCKGVQVGLFNTCTDLRGFQIGLWNKNTKRSLPIINWNFTK